MVLAAILVGLSLGAMLSGSSLSKKIKSHRTLGVLAMCLLSVVFLTGCNAAWLTAVSAMLPTLEALAAAAVSFVVGLEGKTVPADVVAGIQKIGADINTEIANARSLISAYQSSSDTNLLGQISAVLQSVLSNLGQILSGFNITDGSTVSKLTQLIGFAIAAAQAVLAIIPQVTATLVAFKGKQVDAAYVEHADKAAAAILAHHHKALNDGYTAWRAKPSGNADVDAVVQTLPASI